MLKTKKATLYENRIAQADGSIPLIPLWSPTISASHEKFYFYYILCFA